MYYCLSGLLGRGNRFEEAQKASADWCEGIIRCIQVMQSVGMEWTTCGHPYRSRTSQTFWKSSEMH